MNTSVPRKVKPILGPNFLARMMFGSVVKKIEEAEFRKAARERASVTCVECGSEVPPGKPGRKCKSCRS